MHRYRIRIAGLVLALAAGLFAGRPAFPERWLHSLLLTKTQRGVALGNPVSRVPLAAYKVLSEAKDQFGELPQAVSEGEKSDWEGSALHGIHTSIGPPPVQAPGAVRSPAMEQSMQVSSTIAPVLVPVLGARWRTLQLYLVLGLVIMTLTLGEWRWMIGREKQLRVLVEERTRELEAEKSELLRVKAALVRLASHDSLTGVYNRGAILELLQHQIKTACLTPCLEQCSFAVILIDVDHFKRINDTHGHLVGDEVLREFAGRIVRNLRPCDHVGRYGGEELLIMMPGMKEEAAPRIEALHRRITEQPFVSGGLNLRVTCSFGVCWSTTPRNNMESLLSLADKALYAAKANGRNRVEVAEPFLLANNTPETGVYPLG